MHSGPTCPACREPVTLRQWRRSGGWGDTFRCGGCGVPLRWELVLPAVIAVATIPVFLFAIPLGPLALFPAIGSALLMHWRFGRCSIVRPAGTPGPVRAPCPSPSTPAPIARFLD